MQVSWSHSLVVRLRLPFPCLLRQNQRTFTLPLSSCEVSAVQTSSGLRALTSGHVGWQLHFCRVLLCLQICCSVLSLRGMTFGTLFPRTKTCPGPRMRRRLIQVSFASHRAFICQEVDCLLSLLGQNVIYKLSRNIRIDARHSHINVSFKHSLFISKFWVLFWRGKNV